MRAAGRLAAESAGQGQRTGGGTAGVWGVRRGGRRAGLGLAGMAHGPELLVRDSGRQALPGMARWLAGVGCCRLLWQRVLNSGSSGGLWRRLVRVCLGCGAWGGGWLGGRPPREGVWRGRGSCHLSSRAGEGVLALLQRGVVSTRGGVRGERVTVGRLPRGPVYRPQRAEAEACVPTALLLCQGATGRRGHAQWRGPPWLLAGRHLSHS